jgi:hypothetical protein
MEDLMKSRNIRLIGTFSSVFALFPLSISSMLCFVHVSKSGRTRIYTFYTILRHVPYLICLCCSHSLPDIWQPLRSFMLHRRLAFIGVQPVRRAHSVMLRPRIPQHRRECRRVSIQFV